MNEEDNTERPTAARGYKGPRWLIDRLPRFSSSDRESGDD